MKLNKFSALAASFSIALTLTACACVDSEKSDNKEAISTKYTHFTAEDALNYLKVNNQKYVTTNEDADLRNDLFEHGQHPYAVVITCSDSRDVPEKVFSSNFGDIFTIRTAGNVISEFEQGSVEYGVEHLGAKVVLVLGHTNCGAVTAAYEHKDNNEEQSAISSIVKEIVPSVKKAKNTLSEQNEVIAKAVEFNVENSIAKVRNSKILAELEKTGKIKIVGAVYDIKSGVVAFME